MFNKLTLTIPKLHLIFTYTVIHSLATFGREIICCSMIMTLPVFFHCSQFLTPLNKLLCVQEANGEITQV